MDKKRILWAVVFGSMLAITGCDTESTDPGGGGSGGTAGTGGTAGSGGTAGTGGTAGSGGTAGTGGTAGSGGTTGAVSSCDAICAGNCIFGVVDPTGGGIGCLTACEVGAAQWDDECGPEMEAFLDCIDQYECNPEASECSAEASTWAVCTTG